MTIVTVKHQIHVHAGGSKFYETLLLTRSGLGSVLIKRYGKINQADGGGGMLKIEDYATGAEAHAAMVSIWKEKNKPKEYGSPMSINHGFGLLVGGENQYDDTEMNDLFSSVTNHYSGDSNTGSTIMGFLGWKDKFDPNAGTGPVETKWRPTETEDFGSW